MENKFSKISIFFISIFVVFALTTMLIIHILPKQKNNTAEKSVLADESAISSLSASPGASVIFKINTPTIMAASLDVYGMANLHGGLQINGKSIDLTNLGSTGTPTIITASSSGVLTLQGKTGDLKLQAGSGINLNDLTISNSDTGSSQNIFKNITIPGVGTLTAGNNNDTLTLKAGTGLSFVPNGATNTLTVNQSLLTGLTPNTLLYSDGNSLLSFPASSSGYVLRSNGTNTLPYWANATDLSVGSVPFSGIDNGTNTTAAMIVGNGASLTYTGGIATNGSINANLLLNGTWASPGSIGSATANSGTFTNLASTGSFSVSKSNPEIDLTDTTGNKTWKFSLSNSGHQLNLVSMNNANEWTVNGDGDSTTITNLIGISKYGGAVSLITRGSSGQSNDLLQLQNNNGQVLSSFNYNGDLIIGGQYPNLGNAAAVINQQGSGDIFSASSSGVPVFKIDNSGNTRITASLCVKASMSTNCSGSNPGTIYANNSTIQNADVAENYISNQTLEPGDIIMPAMDGNNQAIIKTQIPYQSQTIGIVSTNPGITLNSDATTDNSHPNKYPIALQGRVPVKVTVQNGKINAGDLLTSSSVPGVAMKATQPGQTIGKALEGYDTDDRNAVGKIMVFINISSTTAQITDQQATVGEATLPAGQTSVQIENNTIKEKSSVFVTPTSYIEYPVYVTGQTDGKSFNINIAHAEPKDVQLKWWIVN